MYPAVRTSHSHQIHLAKQTPARISSRSRWCCCRRKQASHPAIQPPSRNDVQTRLCRALIPPPLPLCLSAPVPARAHVLRCDVMCIWPTEPSEAWHFRRARGIPLLFGRRAAPLASFLWGWKTTVLCLRLALPPRPLLCLLPFAFCLLPSSRDPTRLSATGELRSAVSFARFGRTALLSWVDLRLLLLFCTQILVGITLTIIIQITFCDPTDEPDRKSHFSLPSYPRHPPFFYAPNV